MVLQPFNHSPQPQFCVQEFCVQSLCASHILPYCRFKVHQCIDHTLVCADSALQSKCSQYGQCFHFLHSLYTTFSVNKNEKFDTYMYLKTCLAKTFRLRVSMCELSTRYICTCISLSITSLSYIVLHIFINDNTQQQVNQRESLCSLQLHH